MVCYRSSNKRQIFFSSVRGGLGEGGGEWGLGVRETLEK